MKSGIILLGHGSGGLLSRDLTENYILPRFTNPVLDNLSDSALLDIGTGCSKLAFSTDSFVVTPLFFPGGDIGKLAVCGTVNDLAVSGAIPKYLSCSFIIEEGLEFSVFEKILRSMEMEAKNAGVEIVTGDTKVVDRSKADKIFINTGGIGILTGLKFEKPVTGDCILINGSLGDHGMTIFAAREELGVDTPLQSDCCSLNHMIGALVKECGGIKFMRDPTRGGLASAANELVSPADFGMLLYEDSIPVKEEVRSLCDMVGFDPLQVANEGKVMIVISAGEAEKALGIMKNFSEGREASIIGEITGEHKGKVVLKTNFGTKRIVDMLSGAQLPRIC